MLALITYMGGAEWTVLCMNLLLRSDCVVPDSVIEQTATTVSCAHNMSLDVRLTRALLTWSR